MAKRQYRTRGDYSDEKRCYTIRPRFNGFLFFPCTQTRRHDVARSIATEAGHHQLHRVPGPFAQRTTDAYTQPAAVGRRGRGRRGAERPGQMAVRSTRQPSDRPRNNGLDTSVEILQAPAADRMLGGRRRQGPVRRTTKTRVFRLDSFFFFLISFSFSLYLSLSSSGKNSKKKKNMYIDLLVIVCFFFQ